MRGLRRLRTRLPRRGDLLRGRHPGGVEGLLRGECGILLRSRLSRWRRQVENNRQGPSTDRGVTAPRARRVSLAPPAKKSRRSVAADLPDFPWDTLASAKAIAQAHPDGIVDLSIGTPIDPTPDIARRALSRAANNPGYPLTSGTARLREAIAGYLTRRWGATSLDPGAVLPVIGTKELVAWLPTLLGLGPDDLVVYPRTAYPTYLVGSKIAGCRAIACDYLDELGDEQPALVWINSPSNPTGQILDMEAL